jgi:hypothetical protein
MKLNKKEQAFVEGYVSALYNILSIMNLDGGHCKSYDPCKCEEDVVHSYVFNLKDGGRHHNLNEYKDIQELLKCFTEEFFEDIAQEASTNQNIFTTALSYNFIVEGLKDRFYINDYLLENKN